MAKHNFNFMTPKELVEEFNKRFKIGGTLPNYVLEVDDVLDFMLWVNNHKNKKIIKKIDLDKYF